MNKPASDRAELVDLSALLPRGYAYAVGTERGAGRLAPAHLLLSARSLGIDSTEVACDSDRDLGITDPEADTDQIDCPACLALLAFIEPDHADAYLIPTGAR